MYKYLRMLMDIAERIGEPETVFMGENYVSVDGRIGGTTGDQFSLNISIREEKYNGT